MPENKPCTYIATVEDCSTSKLSPFLPLASLSVWLKIEKKETGEEEYFHFEGYGYELEFGVAWDLLKKTSSMQCLPAGPMWSDFTGRGQVGFFQAEVGFGGGVMHTTFNNLSPKTFVFPLGGLGVHGLLGAFVGSWEKKKYQLEREHVDARPVQESVTPATPRFDVILVSSNDNQVAVVRAIREHTGLDLKSVKALVDKAPQPIGQALQREEAEALFETIKTAGGTAEIKPAN